MHVAYILCFHHSMGGGSSISPSQLLICFPLVYKATQISSHTHTHTQILVSPRGVLVDVGGGGVGLGIVAALGDEPEDIIDDEEYTIVTRHMPNNNSYRKVYDGKGKSTRCVFDISPVEFMNLY
ncbi:hypothetical protein Hanom_Chr07g00591361 [Helianthus anomalus]